jgi:hypothetical protein
MNPTPQDGTAEVIEDGTTEPTPTDAHPDTTPPEEVIIDETSEPQEDNNPLEKRYKESSKEALRQKQRADEAEAKNHLLEDALRVKQDNSNIFAIAKEDLDQAERVSQNVFGKSFQQVEDDGLSEDSELTEDQRNQIRLRRMFQEEKKKEKAENDAEKVKDLESSYFANQGLTPGSTEHSAAVNQYKELTNGMQGKSSEYVKNAMSLIYKAVTGKPAVDNALVKKQMEQANISVSSKPSDGKKLTDLQEIEAKFEKTRKKNYWNQYAK